MKKRNRLVFLIIILFVLFISFVSSKIVRIIDSSKLEETIINVFSEEENWEYKTELNIFNNLYAVDTKLIYPGAKGKYKFTINNNGIGIKSYVISLKDYYNYKVNMLYRITEEDNYIMGNIDDFCSVEDVEVVGSILENGSVTYILEWYWNDSINDTVAGVKDNYYTLDLIIRS